MLSHRFLSLPLEILVRERETSWVEVWTGLGLMVFSYICSTAPRGDLSWWMRWTFIFRIWWIVYIRTRRLFNPLLAIGGPQTGSSKIPKNSTMKAFWDIIRKTDTSRNECVRVQTHNVFRKLKTYCLSPRVSPPSIQFPCRLLSRGYLKSWKISLRTVNIISGDRQG